MIRRSVLFLLFGMVMLACSGGVKPAGAPETVRTVFVVEGMHCDGCSSSITGALEGIDGVESASADHEVGTAEAVYRVGNVTPEDLKTAIAKLGYTVASSRTEPVSADSSQDSKV